MFEVKVPVEVTLKLPDNREFVVHTDCLAEYADCHDFWWLEGNGSCDCNRSLYLNREYPDLKLGAFDDHHQCYEMECGETLTMTKLVIDGKDIKV